MVQYLTGLSWVAIALVVGIFISYIASKIKLPDILLLIISGVLLGLTKVKLNDFIPNDLLAAFAIFALIIMVFDSTKDLKLNEIKQLSPYSLKLALIFFICVVALMPIPLFVLFTKGGYLISSLLLALLFALLLSGTSPATVLTLFKGIKNEFLNLLEFESIINTPIIVIFPVIVLNFYVGKAPDLTYVLQFFQQILFGLGIGILVGYLFSKIIQWMSKEKLSSLLIVSMALLIYVISENLGGNGILAVTSFGVIYGKTHMKDKFELEKFTDLFATFLKIIVFLLIGLMIDLSYYTKDFLIKAGAIILLYYIIRFISVNLTFGRSKVTMKEKIFLSMNAAKGVGEGVIVLIIGSYNLESLKELIQLVLLFIPFTILISIISTKISKYLIKFKEEEKHALKRIKELKIEPGRPKEKTTLKEKIFGKSKKKKNKKK